jgi:hypothetical protein
MWWLHLLIRRADKLCNRVAVFERTVRAVGRFAYGAMAEPLIVIHRYCGLNGGLERISVRYYGRTVSPADLPGYVDAAGYMAWWRNGLRHRRVGQLAIVRCSPDLNNGPDYRDAFYLNGVEVDEHGVPLSQADGAPRE